MISVGCMTVIENNFSFTFPWLPDQHEGMTDASKGTYSMSVICVIV